MTSITISVDKDLPLPDGNPRAHSFAPLAGPLRNLAVGDSFFMARATLNDVAGLVRFGDRLGIKLKAFEVDDDEIYLLPGVRIWRVGDDSAEVTKGAGVLTETRSLAEQQRLGLLVDVVALCREHGAEHLRFHLGRFSIDRLKLIAHSAGVDPTTGFAISKNRDEVIAILVEHAKQALLSEYNQPLTSQTEPVPKFSESMLICLESPFDPVVAAKRCSSDHLHKKLSDCTWPELHRMLDEFGFDPGKVVRTWTSKTQVVDAIHQQATGRASEQALECIAAKSKTSVKTPVKSEHWRLPDGTCFRFKSEVECPKKGAVAITRLQYQQWEEEQEL